MGHLVAAIALASAVTYQRNPPAPRATDEETRRVEVVADVERSVVVIEVPISTVHRVGW